MQADPFIEPINRAIDSGVSIVTFAADLPNSKRISYITSDNLAEAKFAAEEIAKLLGGKGEYAVLENPGQSNHDLRVTAFIAYMEEHYPGHEAGRTPGLEPGFEQGLSGGAGHAAGQPEPRRPLDPRGRLGRGRGRSGARGRRRRRHHARRRHADHARAHQGRQHPHGAEPEPGHAGLHGLPRHLHGGASRT